MPTTTRMNIRNAYLDSDTDALLVAWNERMVVGDYEAAKWLRQLLNEALSEIEMDQCSTFNWTT